MGSILAYNDLNNNSYRSYIQVPLTNTLLDGLEYHVSMHILLNNQCNYAVKELGMYFSPDSIWQANFQFLNLSPQYEQNSDYLSNKTDWVQISGSFIANNNFNYLIIGNFNDNSNTSLLEVSSWGDDIAQYFIDEVCVSRSADDCQSPVLSTDFIIYESKARVLIKTVDAMGRECIPQSGELLFYIYDDGSIEKKVIVE